MKILFVCNYHNLSNPFVKTLVDELHLIGHHAIMDCNMLWTDDSFDIIHFQWPEAVYDWSETVSHTQVNSLRLRLENLKKNGKKIVITCHNLQPHTNKDKGVNDLYNLIYQYCDLFVHMGGYSLEILRNQYPTAFHTIIPHHIYDTIYNYVDNKGDCQRILGINANKFNILCFGDFRTDQERNLVVRLIKFFKNENISFVNPGFYRKNICTKRIIDIPNRLLHHIRYKSMGLKYTTRPLNDREVELFFSACDAVMIPRFEILNSGNLPMGFFAGKVVIGPNKGNVGYILNDTGNPVFNPYEDESVIKSIRMAKTLSRNGKGYENRALALERWNTKRVVELINKAYHELY